ncbi:tripartite tricarboxylate transporter substrate binding protein [Roseomonas sp. AR75]|uniref:tripartite tricarboxylate transporter substrate binding protein n=1 Tax=Roseomonas sp. AR75 TaxID=2562311 RepID=UPI0010C119FA|nr:tripartite tricarboxylate transporter substrate binding protein [Roseomonas sp. AR75]
MATRLDRRSLLALTAATAALARPALAQEYPTRTIRIIVPRAPGGGSDNIARVLAPPLGERLRQTIVVENKPDATAIVGAEFVARSAPDGYTLYLSDNSFYQNPAIIAQIPYDTVRDFAPVTRLARAPVILIVHPSVPARNVQELIAYAKANPGKLNYASGGVGSSTHFAGVLFNLRAGTDITHVVFRSSGPALTALVAGQVQMQWGGISSAKPMVEDGRARAIAVTGPDRDPSMPNVPTLDESGLTGVDITSVWGLHAPAGTPMEIRRKLRDAIAATMQEPAVNQRLRGMGYAPVASTPEDHARETAEFVALWQDIAKRVNLKD